jgi:hypothetical protein|tara:strand:+ start:1264 stop:2055 length:792 start_codon:yes stop_codon:yes gene_type:complete
MKKLLLIATILFIWSCAASNPYTRFYKSRLEENKTVQDYPNFIISSEGPKIYSTSDMEGDIIKLKKKNYQMIGYSSFNAGSVNSNQAITQAKLVGAEIVLISYKYTNTVSGNIPLTLPDTETSTTKHSGSIGGDSYYGTSKTTISTKKTYNIPYNTRRYDYGAVYFVKSKPLILGISFEPIPDEIRKLIKRNRGVYVTLVVDDSPAYYADLVNGDIIISIEGEEINKLQDLYSLLKKHSGNRTKFSIIREGNTASEDKYIDLN